MHPPPRRRQPLQEQIIEAGEREQPQAADNPVDPIDGNDSDPYGLYNASPPRRPEVAQVQRTNESLPEAQPRAANEPVDSGFVDPDETEEYISSQSRSSGHESLSSSSDERSRSRGRTLKSNKRKSKKSKRKHKKRLKGRR